MLPCSVNAVLTDCSMPSQKNILGNFGLGHAASIQLEFKRGDGQQSKTATVKSKGSEPEQLPLYSNKDSIHADVCFLMLPAAAKLPEEAHSGRACLMTMLSTGTL